MNQDTTQPQPRSASASRAIRVLLALAALTAAGLSLGACTCVDSNGHSIACPVDEEIPL